MLPRFQRLTSAQFDRAFGHSQSVRHPLLALKAHYRDDDCDIVRAAFVVPKKQARAVSRNRTRRRLRERYRLHPRRNELNGCDLIFLSTPATHDASGAELDEALDEVMRRMKRKLGAGADFGSANPFAARPGKAGKCRPSPTAAETVSTKVDNSADGGLVANGFAEPKSAPAEPAVSSQTSIFAAPALAVIRFYQRFVSPGLPPSCRFYPSCSRYTYGAIERFGLARGLWLGAYRVCRCHPWNAGGIDEVPAYFPAPHVVKARALEKFKALISRRRFDSPRN